MTEDEVLAGQDDVSAWIREIRAEIEWLEASVGGVMICMTCAERNPGGDLSEVTGTNTDGVESAERLKMLFGQLVEKLPRYPKAAGE